MIHTRLFTRQARSMRRIVKCNDAYSTRRCSSTRSTEVVSHLACAAPMLCCSYSGGRSLATQHATQFLFSASLSRLTAHRPLTHPSTALISSVTLHKQIRLRTRLFSFTRYLCLDNKMKSYINNVLKNFLY